MPATPKPRDDEDADLSLPELDGDEGEGEGLGPQPGGAVADDADDVLSVEDDGAGMDDQTGEDRDVFGQNELDPTDEESFLDDLEPPEDIDPDLPEIPGSTVSLLDDGEGKGDDLDDLDIDAGPAGPLDGGEEGPLDEDEELGESDLPRLDADEEGEVDETALFEMEPEEDAPLPWGQERWVPAGAPVECGEVQSVAADPLGGVALLHDGSLVRLDLEGVAKPLGPRGARAGCTRVRCVDGGLLVDGDAGAMRSDDHGETFVAATAADQAEALRQEAAFQAEIEPWATSLAHLEVVAGVTQRPAGGTSGESAAGAAGATAVLLLVTLPRGEPRLWLARAERGAATPQLVAELEIADTANLDVRDMAWDETRGVAWIVGAFGARAYQRATRPSAPS